MFRAFITEMGTDVLGGTKLWVKGESGTYYYYAHLSAFEEGITNGSVVDAGDVVGYVGTTGRSTRSLARLTMQPWARWRMPGNTAWQTL